MFLSEIAVSLLVRLWVEMSTTDAHKTNIWSASLWGCELKYQVSWILRQMCIVSLLVRLWVEILLHLHIRRLTLRQPPCEAVSWNEFRCSYLQTNMSSASLWGCELKYLWQKESDSHKGQPPCEAVSWNVAPLSEVLPFSTSASLWGCELKYKVYIKAEGEPSQPPCEAVSWNTVVCALGQSGISQPPCEAVSWNNQPVQINFMKIGSASLWGCELKCCVKAQTVTRV